MKIALIILGVVLFIAFFAWLAIKGTNKITELITSDNTHVTTDNTINQ